MKDSTSTAVYNNELKGEVIRQFATGDFIETPKPFISNLLQERDVKWVAKIALFLQKEAPELHEKFIEYLKLTKDTPEERSEISG